MGVGDMGELGELGPIGVGRGGVVVVPGMLNWAKVVLINNGIAHSVKNQRRFMLSP